MVGVWVTLPLVQIKDQREGEGQHKTKVNKSEEKDQIWI